MSIILHSGTTFTGSGKCTGVPTKRQVLERTFYFRNFRTADTVTANDVVDDIYDRWVCYNVYPLHRPTIGLSK